jgi:Tfp pilus assembly protein PilN
MKEMARLRQIVQARAPSMDRMLQSLPRKTRKSTGFQRFWKMVGAVVSVIIAVIFGNPVVMVAAIAGPGGLLRG